MLAFYHRLARKLYPMRHLLWLCTAAAAAISVFAVFDRGGALGEGLLLPAVMVFAWLIAALSVVYGFVEALPSAQSGMPLLRRVAIHARRSYFWLMAALMSAVSIALAVLCVRAVGIALRS